MSEETVHFEECTFPNKATLFLTGCEGVPWGRWGRFWRHIWYWRTPWRAYGTWEPRPVMRVVGIDRDAGTIEVAA